MVYIEQPDGSEHQFLLTDPRQGTNPKDPNSIGAGQDPAKVARYASYIRFAYQTADNAVKRIADAAGPDSNVIVVSDHGFAPFHTSVSMTNILKNAGIDTTKVAIRTSGPAANIYINLQQREQGGTVDPATYQALLAQITAGMSATFIASGSGIRDNTTIRRMRNLDVAPTIMQILGVRPHGVDGEVLNEILR